MKTSITKITNYAWENFNTHNPSTNDVYHIYTDENGMLSHVMASMEYRGYEKSHVVTISLCNEYAPYTKKQVKAQIEYQSEKLEQEYYRYNRA